MAWDSVPWFIGGGAQHSPEVARLLAYAATSGAEGIIEPGDLKVSALSVPGGAVNIAPGAALIRNRATGGDQQTYIGRNPVQDSVQIAATSGSKRSDLIVAQIEDPFMAGEPWQDPADPAVGPYVFTRVIPNVPAGTTSLQGIPEYSGRSAVVLARVDLPASTGTVTAAHIVDLRKLALPRSYREVQMEQVSINQDLTSSSEVKYPNTEPYFQVPTWATHAFVQFRLSGIAVVNGALEGWFRVGYGPLGGTATKYGESLYFDFNAPTGGVSREEVVVSAFIPIPEADRGAMRVLRLYARKGGTGVLRTHNGTQAAIDIQFYERAV